MMFEGLLDYVLFQLIITALQQLFSYIKSCPAISHTTHTRSFPPTSDSLIHMPDSRSLQCPHRYLVPQLVHGHYNRLKENSFEMSSCSSVLL